MSCSNSGHYAAPHKAEILNWISGGTNYQVVQSTGTWTLQPYEISPPGLVALKVQRGTGNNDWLWVEYRQPIGIYESQWAPSGAVIHYEDSTTYAHTQILDFTPGDGSLYNGALMPGNTWTDPYSNVSITVQSADPNGMTVSVNYAPISCTGTSPTVSASPLNPSIYPGNTASYSVTVTDNDSSGCAASTYTLNSDQPASWPTSFSPGSVTLNPGQSGTVTMYKTGPQGTPPGTYAVNANASNSHYSGSGTANVTVMNVPSLAASLSVSGTAFTRPGTVSMTASVTNGGNPVSGAKVTFTVTLPNGSTTTQTATSGSDGTATWNYKLSTRSATGTYSAVAQAAVGTGRKGNTQTATSNTVSFTVQ
jgi:alpha-galactosidase-like protein